MDASIDIDEERELLLRLRQGDDGAFDRLYHLYGARIFRNILKLVHDEQIAKELLQDVFLKIWEKREGIDTQQSFPSYLFTISRNLVYDYFRHETMERKLRAYLAVTEDAGYRHIEEDFIYNESNELFVQTVDRLPPQRKLVYTLCKIEGKSYQEVSNLLGISESTISDHVLKANKLIRAQFIYCAALSAIVLSI